MEDAKKKKKRAPSKRSRRSRQDPELHPEGRGKARRSADDFDPQAQREYRVNDADAFDPHASMSI